MNACSKKIVEVIDWILAAPKVLRLSAIFFVVSTNLICDAGYANSDEYLNVQKVLPWFSADVQSLLVTQGPYELPDSKSLMVNLENPTFETIRLLAVVPWTEVISQKFYPAIEGRQVALAVEALGPYPSSND